MMWTIKSWGSCKNQIAVRLPDDIKKELMDRAKQKGLSLSDLVRVYIEKGLTEERKTEILRGMV
jgi:antitoxin component of RelBE/YafQ-DinJ toxin-antitoxin module